MKSFVARVGLLFLCFATRAGAQAAPTAAKATTADFAWLAGSWEAHPAGTTATIEITYQPPNAGFIGAIMRLVDKSKIMVVELLSIVDTPEGPEMRFRHFSAALTAYEAEFKQNMRLTAITADQATFENQVAHDPKLMSTQVRKTTFIRKGKDEFVGRSEIINTDGTNGVMESTYRRKAQ